MKSDITNSGGGVITTAYGLYTGLTNSGSGSITNGYGLYINSVAGTNKWALYSNDTSTSFFNGSVGIGTNAPVGKLHVVGSIKESSSSYFDFTQERSHDGIYDRLVLGISSGNYRSLIGATAGFEFHANLTNPSNSTGDVTPEMYLTTNGLGIGVTPTEKLEVNGAIKIGNTATAAPTAGTIRFNTTTSKFEGYDGTTWVAFH